VEEEIRKNNAIHNSLKKKILRTSLTKEVKHLYNENCKTLNEEIKEILED
jgi:hypothetical protein